MDQSLKEHQSHSSHRSHLRSLPLASDFSTLSNSCSLALRPLELAAPPPEAGVSAR